MQRLRMRIVFAFIICFRIGADHTQADAQVRRLEGTITLSGAWALYPMAVKWAEEFRKIHPGVRIDIGAGGAGKGMADCLAGVVDIGMVSREIFPEEIKKGAWYVPVTKDAVVPTVNAKNPLLNALLGQGLTRDTFVRIWVTGDIQFWGRVTGVENRHRIHVYTRSDACGAAETWAKYLGKHQEDLRDVGVYGDPGLAEAVRKDALAIGFNNINYAYDASTKKQIEGVRVLPIDLNENGMIDANENFYGTRDEIVHAISTGTYPSPPARDLYFVCHGRPERELIVTFTEWVLTDGQEYTPESGYIRLSDEKRMEGLKKLDRQ